MKFLDQLKKLDAEATPGKWSEMGTIIDGTGDAFLLVGSEYLTSTDVDLICLLRNNTQAIIELVIAANNSHGFHCKMKGDQCCQVGIALSKLKGDV